MSTVAATEIKNRFGRYLEACASEPVVIEKAGRPVAVLLGYAQYEQFERLEDAYWARLAEEAAAEGGIGVEESMKYIERFREMDAGAEA